MALDSAAAVRAVKARLGWSGLIAALVIAVLAAMALLAPVIAPYDPASVDLSQAFAGSSGAHPLGNDGLGRDLLSRLIWGARPALLGALVVVAASTAAGVLLAMTAAWRGGWVDATISRALDIVFAFPGLLLALLAVAVFGAGLPAAAVALAIAYTPYIGRVTRGAAIREGKLPYVAALRLQGSSAPAIVRRHLLPNLSPIILAQASLSFGYAMVDLAAISYLGLGVQEPTADWGLMVATGQSEVVRGYPAQAISAGVLIVVAVTAFMAVGERLAEPGARLIRWTVLPAARARLRSSRRIGPSRPTALASRPEPLLTVEGLSMALPMDGGLRPILRDVSFSICPGESLALVGESGSGKSMTARSVVRLLPAVAAVDGRIEFENRSVLAMDRHELRSYRARDVGMVFQDPRAYSDPVRRIADQITEALTANQRLPPTAALRRAAELLEATGVADPERVMRQYPHELSGGQLQRVLIAIALSSEPKLLLADEATTALDVTTQAEVMSTLSRLRRDMGLALILITHDLDLAAATCDRTTVMYAGSTIESQPSLQLHNAPQHPYTAALLAARPALEAHHKDLCVVPGQPVSGAEVRGGCSFAPRCPYAESECVAGEPPRHPVPGGYAACIRVGALQLGPRATVGGRGGG